MPTINKRTVMTANGTAEPVVGDANEFIRDPSIVEVGLVASATGVIADVFSGNDQIADSYAIPVATINTNPKYPDDFLNADSALPGDRIRVKLRETAGGTPTVITSIRVTPVG